MPTFQALSAFQTIAIRHASSPITTCSLHLVALLRSLRLVVALTSHVLSLGQQQTATDHSPLAVWSPQRASSDAGCQEEARARAPRWYKCLSLVPMERFSFFLPSLALFAFWLVSVTLPHPKTTTTNNVTEIKCSICSFQFNL